MTTPRPRRRYPDADRAAALAALDANGGNVDATARQLNIPRMTLSDWASGRRNPVGADMRDAAKQNLADALEAWAVKLIGIDPTTLPNLTLRDVAVAVGISIDKVLLLRGQPNAITLTTAGPDPSAMTD